MPRHSKRLGRNLIYKVLVEATAQTDALEYAGFLLESSKSATVVEKWLRELESAVQELAELPHRYRTIDEQPHFGIELRQFIHYSHRVIFHINEARGTVHVLRIYHANRDELIPALLPEEIG